MNTDSLDEAPEPLVDLEARAEAGQQMSLRLWLRMLACTTRIEGVVRARLRDEFDISLARFDLLAQLERSVAGLRMRELSQRLMVTGGNVTGLVDELEREGWVERRDDPDDRRAWAVRLTPAGRTWFRRMAHKHGQWVDELFDGLSGAEKSRLYGLLHALKAHVSVTPARNTTQRRQHGTADERRPRAR